MVVHAVTIHGEAHPSVHWISVQFDPSVHWISVQFVTIASLSSKKEMADDDIKGSQLGAFCP